MKFTYLILTLAVLVLASCAQPNVDGIDLDDDAVVIEPAEPIQNNQPDNQQNAQPSTDAVQVGDTVSLYYVGTTDDGEIFDTNVASVVEENNLQVASTDPLTFQVGAGQMIRGFDQGVVGMKVGETKNLVLQPEEAYGQPDPTRVQSYPKERELNRTEQIQKTVEVPAQAFAGIFGEDPEVDKIYTTADLPFNYKVTAVQEALVELSIEAQVGDVYQIPGANWDTEVVEIGETTVSMRHNPEDGQSIQGIFGDATVRVTQDTITIVEDAEVGQEISTPLGLAKVAEVTEDEILVDLNHPLAGQVLNFQIEIVSIN